ncbi:hypothetical protein BGZ49_003815 [Haplosporangium sp. Z 27]|nr:hypothetical protein BGZ49_003815 [Haplosporangium sp. Z 27]
MGSSNIGDAMIIYNIKEDQWTTTFTPINSSSTPGASTPTGITDPTQTPNKSSLGAPVGAGVGAVVLVAAIGIFIYFRKKAARRKHQNETREPLPTAWESKNIDKDSMSPPAYPPALEKSKTSVQQNSHITLGNPQNPEYSQGAFLPGTTDLKNPQWAAPGQLHRHSSGPRSPQALQPQESTSRAIEDDILTEEQLEHIIASQLRLQQQQLLHQQEMERIRIEQEALLVKLKQKLKA